MKTKSVTVKVITVMTKVLTAMEGELRSTGHGEYGDS